MSEQCWTPAYVGLGSNLEDPAKQVDNGFAALARLPDTLLVAKSKRYRSRPLGPQDQPDFINAVAGLLTRVEPESLLQKLKQLEVELGRELPVRRWGPRVIDFDLLLYGNVSQSSPSLTLPHAGLLLRNWVLYPLSDIAPMLQIPGHGRVSQLAHQLGAEGIEALQACAS